MQAQKDMNVGVKHKRQTFIGGALNDAGEGPQHDDCPPVGEVNEHLTVYADRETIIKGNDTVEVGQDNADTGRKMTVFNGDHHLTVKVGNQVINIDQGGQTTTVKLGDVTRDIQAGKVLEQAAQSIEFKVGGSSIKIEPAKITLESIQIEIKGSATAKIDSAMTEVIGSGMVKLQGGVIKIN